MEQALKAGCDLPGGDREKQSMQGNQMSKGVKEQRSKGFLPWRKMETCYRLRHSHGVGWEEGMEEVTPQIAYYWVSDKIWIILWQDTIPTTQRSPLTVVPLFRDEWHALQSFAGKNHFCFPLQTRAVRRGRWEMKQSSPFSLPVWTAHPRPKGQVITSRFVEKFTLGGLPRM